MMRPALGWAGLSRSALERAEAQLVADSEGVRDEVGVLALHTAYANRFFSRHIRAADPAPVHALRSLANQGIASQSGRHPIRPSSARCARSGGTESGNAAPPCSMAEGTIGRRTASKGRPVAIPPSQSYWVALATWRILTADLGCEPPSRSELFRRWEKWPAGRLGRSTTDDEGRALELQRGLFVQGLPEPPTEFNGDVPLDFKLLPGNGSSCASACSTRSVPETNNPPSFQRWWVRTIRSGHGGSLGAKSVIRHADEADTKGAESGRATPAALSKRSSAALYNAAVEALRERDEGSPIVERHRAHLVEIRRRVWQPPAERLRLGELACDECAQSVT